MDVRADYDQVHIFFSREPDDLRIRPAFRYVRDGLRSVITRQLRHLFLNVAAQTRQRAQSALGKHHRDLFEVVTNDVDGMQFGLCAMG